MADVLTARRHPQHGYAVIEDVAKMTGGRVRLRAGTLYAALLVPPATFAFGLVMLERRETAAPPG